MQFGANLIDNVNPYVARFIRLARARKGKKTYRILPMANGRKSRHFSTDSARKKSEDFKRIVPDFSRGKNKFEIAFLYIN